MGRDLTDPSASAEVAAPPAATASNARSPARYLWAMRLGRLFESLPLLCPDCGADRRTIAFITDTVPLEQILTHIGEPARPLGTMLPSRCRTGTCSPSPHPTSSLTSASPGSRRLSQGWCSFAHLPVARCAPDASPSTPERARLHSARRPSAPQLGVDGAPHPHPH